MIKKEILIAFIIFLALSILGSILFVLSGQPSKEVKEDEFQDDEEVLEDYQEGYEEGYEAGYKDGIENLTIRTSYYPREDQSPDYYKGYDRGYKEGYIEANPKALKGPATRAGFCELPCLAGCFCLIFPLTTITTCFSSIWSCISSCGTNPLLLCPLCWFSLIPQVCSVCFSICCLVFETPLAFVCTLFICTSMEFGSCWFALTGKLLECEIGGLLGKMFERLGICCLMS
jgi:hypothetical protein